VGFIRNLPHTLVTSFRATLEEVAQAEVLLHVRDAASTTAKNKKSRWRRFWRSWKLWASRASRC
jgi:GTP-binding protein HflX